MANPNCDGGDTLYSGSPEDVDGWQIHAKFRVTNEAGLKRWQF